jgi:hypothetical protein
MYSVISPAVTHFFSTKIGQKILLLILKNGSDQGLYNKSFVSAINRAPSPNDPKCTLLRFLKYKFCKKKKVLAFNQERSCHLALCIWFSSMAYYRQFDLSLILKGKVW